MGATTHHQKIYVYCDESSQTKARYMVLGALFLSETAQGTIGQIFDRIRQERLAGMPMKWESISNWFMCEYQEVAMLIANHGQLGRFEYHAMIINTSMLDHDTYNEGDAELGYYKFFFQLLKHRMRHKDAVYYVTMDRRTNRKKHRLADLRSHLNNHLWTNYGYDPVRTIVSRKCSDVNFLQITDILTGAVAFHANDRDKARDASPAKTTIAKKLARALGMARLSDATSSLSAFSVWPFRLRQPHVGQRRAG